MRRTFSIRAIIDVVGIEAWISGSGVFLTASCTCAVVMTAALDEARLMAHGACPMHREICPIEALPPLHNQERDPAPGPMKAYLAELVVSGATAGTFITPASGSLTLTGAPPTLA
jgi:hypothetical protein